jgi:copper chaperone CopZ
MLFAGMQVYSGPNCGASKATTTANVDAKKSCTGHGDMTKAHKMTAEEHAKLCGMTPEECAKVCGGHENCGFTKMNIKGMTCTGCEKSVEAALTEVPGVIKVVKVDHKEGYALVCTQKEKVEKTSLTTAVTNKGYEASIVPAVATSGEVSEKTSAKKGCAATCGKKAAAACAKTKSACTHAKKDGKAEGAH